jgi:hypothetical protein
MLLTLLTVTVVAVGGPPHTPATEPFSGAVVRVVRNGKVVASSEEGNIAVRVRPGTYVLTAEEGEMVTNQPHPCYQGNGVGRTVHVGHRPQSVKLSCQIK